MGRALVALVAVGCLVSIASAHGSAGARRGLSPCATLLYFDGSYYRTISLGKLRPNVGGRVGAGVYVPCDATAPVEIQLRRLRGVRTDVALRDAAHSRLLYVSNDVCLHRGGQRLLRCLRRAKPSLFNSLAAPPGFAATGDHYTLLDYSSSCWGVSRGPIRRITCVDIVWPDETSDVAVVRLTPGASVRFELGFDPDRAALLLHRSSIDFDRVDLAPARAMTWDVPADLDLPKIFEIRAVKEGSGEGAYIGRFVEAVSRKSAPGAR